MSISKKHLANEKLCERIVRMYAEECSTKLSIAAATGVTIATVLAVLQRDLDPARLKSLKSANYRRSKTGTDNPMLGRLPGNFIGQSSDGHGYLTAVEDGKRYPVHRIVFARMLNIHPDELPSSLHVHHIDRNPHNNLPGNLCLVNGAGHRALHRSPLRDKTKQADATPASPRPRVRIRRSMPSPLLGQVPPCAEAVPAVPRVRIRTRIGLPPRR